MTPSENQAATPRPNRAFRFLKAVVSGGTTVEEEFFPGVGSNLRFANQSLDVLSLVGLPAGLLAGGDVIHVKYLDTTVFQGTVETIIDRHSKGDERVQDVTVQGPWGKMQRLLYRQLWGNGRSSSHVILNQYRDGSARSHQGQLSDIVMDGMTKCGYAFGRVDGASLCLPFDETRDITIAAALQRELRFFPKKITRFDYSETPPKLYIEDCETTDAAYLASVGKSARQYEYNNHPISGVYLYAESPAESGSVVVQEQAYPLTADPSDLDVMSAHIPLEPPVAEYNAEYFTAEGEVIPENLNDVNWWKARHPRLENVDVANIIITDGERSSATYPYIAKNTTAELAAVGKHSEVVHFACKCAILTDTDIEEDILLTMDYLTTDAVPDERYLISNSSYVAEGESIPSGLAKAIFEQRSGTLKNETISIRLGASLPKLGDAADGLFLQDFTVDCATLTATLHFGQPEYLSIDDMRGLLSGFRQRRWAKSASVRKKDIEQEDTSESEETFIRPLKSTEFCPGKKIKTEIGDATDGGAVMQLDPSLLPAGAVMKPHTLTIEDESGSGSTRSGSQQMMILATGDVVIPRGGSADNTQRTFTFNGTAASSKFYGTGNISLTAEQKTLIAGTNITLTPSSDGKSITISATGGTSGYGSNTTRKVVADVRYDATNHVLQKRFYTETWNKGVLLSSVLDSGWTTIAQAVEETV